MPTPRSRLTPTRLAIAVGAIAVYWWSIKGTELSLVKFIKGLPGL